MSSRRGAPSTAGVTVRPIGPDGDEQRRTARGAHRARITDAHQAPAIRIPIAGEESGPRHRAAAARGEFEALGRPHSRAGRQPFPRGRVPITRRSRTSVPHDTAHHQLRDEDFPSQRSLQGAGTGRPARRPGEGRRLTRYRARASRQTGEICLDILKKEWSPAWSLQGACRAIIALLSAPAPESPLNCDAGNMLRAGDTAAFNSMARMYTIECATLAMPQPEKEG